MKICVLVLCSLLFVTRLTAQDEELDVKIANNGISVELLGVAVGFSGSYHHYFRLGQDNFLDMRLGGGTAFEGFSLHQGLAINTGGNSKYFKFGLLGNYMQDGFLDSGYGAFIELGYCYQKPWGGFTYGVSLYKKIIGQVDPPFIGGITGGYTF